VIQPHEVELQQERLERKLEDNRLAVLKARVESALAEQKRTVFSASADGRINAA